jgi:TIR domain
MSKIFLSHNHNDKPFVRELASYLRRYGIEVWVDEAEIKIGDSLIEKVGQGIKENAFVGARYFAEFISSICSEQWDQLVRVAASLRSAPELEQRLAIGSSR